MNSFLIYILILQYATLGHNIYLQGGPQFEVNLLYSDSYIPASMQIIAYLTEIMKYELRPQHVEDSTTTTIIKPTRAHKPGLFGPEKPPTTEAYDARLSCCLDMMQKSSFVDKIMLRIQEKKLGNLIVMPRRQPPTRAYVTLLSLYDMLNKEVKKLGLNKFNGFSKVLLMHLNEASSGTSAYQLKFVLSKILENRNTVDQLIQKRINDLLIDLNEDNSYINNALRYIPPLKFEFI